MKRLKLKPSKICKEAGLKGLVELSEITEVNDTTLINWCRNKPKLFRTVVLGAVQIKRESLAGSVLPTPTQQD